jgi:23S rRNA pseudouridine1911/1915/1917 synthase
MGEAEYPDNIRVIFEDNHIIVVEKPQNMPTQADSSKDLDLLSYVKEYLRVKYNKPGDAFIGLVHRLDRPAGGIMIFAKTSKAAGRLSEQIRSHTFEKSYLAVVMGKLNKRQDCLRDFLLKDENTNTVKVVGDQVKNSKEAILEYNVEKYSNGLSLVRINLKTGRSHQIRVQFSNIGNPLYGDYKYNNNLKSEGKKLSLWSNSISFLHPTLKAEMTFTCPTPKEYPWAEFI